MFVRHSIDKAQISRSEAYSATRLGDFWHFLATNFYYKISPNVLVSFWVVVKTIAF